MEWRRVAGVSALVALACGAGLVVAQQRRDASETVELARRSVNDEVTFKCLDASAGPVLRGTDVVEYWNKEPGANATMGNPAFVAYHGDYEFYFATAANRDLFASDPERYAPSWGGFCAYGIADETFWTKTTLGPSANPDVWLILDDRLYVFMYCTPESKFVTDDIRTQIRRGDRIWTTWWGDDTVYNTNCFWDSKYDGFAADTSDGDCLFPSS